MIYNIDYLLFIDYLYILYFNYKKQLKIRVLKERLATNFSYIKVHRF